MFPQYLVRVFTVFVAGGLLVPAAFTQARGGSTPTTGGTSGSGSTTGVGSTGTSPGTGTGRGNIPTTTQPTTPSTPNSVQTPIFISGRVLLEDGTAPDQQVTIERVCGGSVHAEAYTDGRGFFSFELGGRNSAVLADASESGRSVGDFGDAGNSFPSQSNSTTGNSSFGSEFRLANCELRAKLTGYRSQSVSLANRRAMDNPDIGTILVHRLSPAETGTISANTLKMPKDARKAYEKGQDALRKRKLEDALKNFQKAVEVSQDFAAAWYELGRLQLLQGKTEEARRDFEVAVKADPRYAEPYVQIAFLDAQAQKWEQVAEATDQAVKLDSFDFPQAYFFNAVANYNLKHFEAAEKSARKAQQLDTRHEFPRSSHLLGILLAQRRDYTGAAQELRAYLKLAPNSPDAAKVQLQLDEIEKRSAQSAATKSDENPQ